MNFYQQPFGMGQQPVFIGQPIMPQPQFIPQGDMMMGPGAALNPFQPPREEQSYVENILRLNIGKVATVYMNFENSQWGSKIFKGYILAAGKDHLILKDLQTETRYLLLMVYLLYVTFDEEIDYEYPFRKKENKKEK
jgi:spore germination protein Q